MGITLEIFMTDNKAAARFWEAGTVDSQKAAWRGVHWVHPVLCHILKLKWIYLLWIHCMGFRGDAETFLEDFSTKPPKKLLSVTVKILSCVHRSLSVKYR